MPPFIAAALIGTSLFAGYRILKRMGETFAEQMQEAELRQRRTAAVTEKDLGRLEFDPSSGVYRPARLP